MAISPDDIFIPGGLPQETYVSREHLGIEAGLRSWLERRQKPLLSLSGPTKSGKTVLLKRAARDALWFSGGAIDTAEDFWQSVCDALELFTDHELQVGSAETSGLSSGAGMNAGVVSAHGGTDSTTGVTRGLSRSRSTSAKSAARTALKAQMPLVVIDDFHYIPPAEQIQIVRGLKDLVFDGLGVVVAAVPHRAYDVVRVEVEMTGRVAQQPVTLWEPKDLHLIAVQGFAALGVHVSEDVIERLAAESFGSPHLMQTHCLNLCAYNTIHGQLSTVMEEPDWRPFFEAQASSTSKSAFDLLKNGPRTRTDRIPRLLNSGVETDIYGAVLSAIENTGPRTTLTYDEIRASLRSILNSDLPQRHEITNVLDQMTTIARDRIDGEPVLEYDAEYSTLHLVDPFFAYYLRWAPDSMKDLSVRRDG